MKIQAVSAALLCFTVDAFTIPQAPKHTPVSALHGQKNAWLGPAATAALGLTLASQAAFATVIPPQEDMTASSIVVAVEKLDFSLPSYDAIGANTGGFGLGSEAYLGASAGEAPGTNEKEKQAEAMRKAEAARLERKAAEKAAKLQRNEDQLRAAEAKKKADAQRVADFFSGQ